MKNLIYSKKGDLPDVMIFMIIIFIMAIGLFILAYITPAIADGLKTANLNNSVEGSNSINELSNMGTSTLQRGFLLLFFGLAISTLITSFFTRQHPLFIFLYIFFLGITVFVGTFLGNAYEQLTSSPVLAETLASQGMITVIMQNIVLITVVIGALSMIVTFAQFTPFFSAGGSNGQL